ncbi:photosystem II reaction center W protein, chloroplastic-like [Apium graveolens]|uniref:photosystem II reaction center W protein, chloroplastic-like n=1 Tax=Apium graveolens TaxID=4045 RepID=UPI003D7B34DE
MAAITGCNFAMVVTSMGIGQKVPAVRSVVGLPVMPRGEKVRCSMEGRCSSSIDSKVGMGASLVAVATGAAMSSSPAAMALVDERLSTEGTGLPFGLSNNLLGWILLGMFGLIWSLYFIYASGLDEDDDSGLSL